jgi:hypothetical protein
MTWKHGTAELYSPSKDANETLPALISDDGIAIFGFSEPDEQSVFAYKSGNSKFSFLASRFSSSGVLTDTWTVGLATIKRDLAILHGASFAKNNLAKVVCDIEGALLTDPAWPTDFGRPDLPARIVQFRETLP